MSDIDAETLQRLSDAFDAECESRHLMGEEKYGPVQFMTVNSIEMAMEEVADLANYARYTWIKLALLAASSPVEPLTPTADLSNEASGFSHDLGFFSSSGSKE